MNRRISKMKKRSQRGAILVLSVLILAFVFLPAAFFLNKCGLLVETHSSYQSAIDSASLLVADQISQIVVNDPHFGYIALSNQPPIGKATLADDGQACPVTSINNLLATIRLDTIIANQYNDTDLVTLVDADYVQAKRATALLQSSLNAATAADRQPDFTDSNGNRITLYAAAKELLAKNLQFQSHGRNLHVRSLRISLGWLKDGGTTNTRLPEPLSFENLPDQLVEGANYRSCVDVPSCGKSFYFAAAGRKPSLADASMFAEPDEKRFCSVVKVEADIEDSDLLEIGSHPQRWLHLAACAIPQDTPQAGPTGALLVFFPCGPVNAVRNLNDLLHLHNGDDQPARFYQACGGDLPVDGCACTAPTTLGPWGNDQITSERAVSAGLYCWLRASGMRPRIDATLAALKTEFCGALKSSNLLYEFDQRGNVVISSLAAMPLPLSVLSDRQVFVETRGDNYSISCYNNVYNIGTINGGKHAGQPLAGDPINWCDLPWFGLSTDAAKSLGKGAATGLSPASTKLNDSPILGAVPSDGAVFEVNGKAVQSIPRKSYYSGGLAVELSISAI